MSDDTNDPLERWLDSMNQVQPASDQLRRWMKLPRSDRQRRSYFNPQVAAALVAGFLLGLGVLGLRAPSNGREPATTFDPNATVEVVFDKSL